MRRQVCRLRNLEVIQLMEEAAELGVAVTVDTLARKYRDGIKAPRRFGEASTAPDRDRALVLLRRVAEMGHPATQEVLADALEQHAMAEPELTRSDGLWLAAFRHWARAVHLAQVVEDLREEEWRFAVEGRSALAFLLRDRGWLVDAAGIYTESAALPSAAR